MLVKLKSAAVLAVVLALAAPFGCGGGDDAPVNPLAPSPTGGGVPPDTAPGWSAASPARFRSRCLRRRGTWSAGVAAGASVHPASPRRVQESA